MHLPSVRRAAGVLSASGALLALAAAPASAVSVTVRIAGDGVQRVAAVDTTTTPVPGAGCPGDSAAGALELATAGTWDRQQFVQSILGEAHTYTANDWWTFWVDGSFSAVGACEYLVQAGDDLLFYVQRDGADFAGTVFPLFFADAPRRAVAGRPFSVTVTEHRTDGTTTTATPIAGATVSDGAGLTATTGADGKATLTVRTPRTIRLTATRAGAVATPVATVRVTRTAGAGTAGPRVRIAGLRDGASFPAGRGPRELRGSVAGAARVQHVQLRLRRRAGGVCSAFGAGRERFVRVRCAAAGRWFAVGDSARWSYLLPGRLGAGDYRLSVRATDSSGATSAVARRRFHVV